MSVFFWAPGWLLLTQLTDYNISDWTLQGMHGIQSNNICILLIKHKDKWHDQTRPTVCLWSLTGRRNAGGKDHSHKVGEMLLSFALFLQTKQLPSECRTAWLSVALVKMPPTPSGRDASIYSPPVINGQYFRTLEALWKLFQFLTEFIPSQYCNKSQKDCVALVGLGGLTQLT